ncbi:ABC-type oligopeptide transport system, periplasmic component [Levilactobacillus senmaizukei DSM 21775 = NBRC 103853]|uniref:ABC-type oligopeptide transport system, periplasmic component n=1 Tax=Levilactobacillus senmaizukei DSM 21775 = NBRC 103853 TaxID=1423803 RepID=A0A0R2DIP5_9LACO|nr:peptide ABC transporter substrate-binding protein [Levilactobacillus senmaizukei]KRN03299.1 ABC-type oligopeptide transport system, periplasmic component [Levilactobacillus senmaizukei DSM 21775 = NBRC 103853]
MKKWTGIGLIAALITVSLSLAACGNSATSSKPSQVLRLPATAQLDTIDLAKATGYGQTGNVFEGFYRLGKNGKVAPGLADSVKESKDQKTWTFHIRDNAKWSNGDKITAQDFVYSWRRTLTPSTKSSYRNMFSGIKNGDQIIAGKAQPETIGIHAKNAQTVVVKLDKPIAYFKILMAYPLFAPQNEKVVNKYGKKYATKSEYMVYSGPFKISNWSGTGNTWSFVKNNHYWDKQVVKLNKVNFQVVTNPQTGLSLYQNNKLDFANLTNEQVKNYKNDKAFKEYPYSIVIHLKYNFQDADKAKRRIMSNQNIRQAIALSINRGQLTEKVLGDGSVTPTGFVASGLAKDPKTGEDFAKQQTVKDSTTYNPSLAKKKWAAGLKELGVKKVDLNIMAGNDDVAASTVTQYLKSALEDNLKGFNLKIQNVPASVAQSRSTSGDFDLYLSHWGADFNDPISFLQIPVSSNSLNYGKWSNKEYDELIDKAQNQDAGQPEVRWQDMIKAAKMLNKTQSFTPLYQANYAYLQRNTVKGIIHNTAGTQWSYKYAYIQ